MTARRQQGLRTDPAASGSQRDGRLSSPEGGATRRAAKKILERRSTRLASSVMSMAVLLILFVANRAEAHATSTSYLVATDSGQDVHITWDFAVADTHWALNLDTDGNGEITWQEIESRRDDISSLALSKLTLERGSNSCVPTLSDMLLTEHAGEPHVSLSLSATCTPTRASGAHESRGALSLSAVLFFDKDATQRTLIDVTTPAGQFTSILSPTSATWLEPPAPSILKTFETFVAQGLWHVWIGYDHLAFLLLLLLPGVLRNTGSNWQGTRNFRETASDLLRIITAFTLAHSITLALAATGTVHVPVRPVEIAIALSIVIAGLLNLFPRAAPARLALAFGFGLIHGFGFANALAELGSHGAQLIPTLAGFNIGVELAQVSLVAILLPLLLRARHSTFYAWRFMPATSLIAAMAGAAWLAARAG